MSRLHIRMLFLLAVLLIETTAAYAGDFTVVADGRSNFSIVVASDAIPAEKFAAAELAAHIKQMSGAELKVISDRGGLPERAILIGRPRYLEELGISPDWAKLGTEGYLIRTLRNHLIIAGGRPRGTMYGVYDLLQKYWGCRWFTFDTSSIPKKVTLTVPDLDAMNRPPFALRDLMIVGGSYHGDWFWPHLDEKYVARVRWNFVTRDFRNTDDSYGGSFRVVNFAHNYIWLVPLGEYGSAHPEYYALHDGKRLNHAIVGNEVELCLSNPDVAQVAAKTIAGALRERPDAEMCFLGQSDTGHYCKCDTCDETRKKYGGWDSARRVEIPGTLPEHYWNEYGGFAGLQIKFANRVAQILEIDFPNVRVGTFAYMYARKPPRDLKAHKNVVVWYCVWNASRWPRRCYSDAVNSGPINDDFENFGAEVGEWRRIANHVYIYDYWLGTWRAQPVNIPTLRRTMRFYRKMGVEGVLLDGIRGIPGGFEWLTFWLASQLMWNPDFDVDQGVDEFCRAYYGAGGPYVKQYVEMASRPESYELTSIPGLYRRGNDRHRTKRFTDDPYKPIKLDKFRDSQLLHRVMRTKAINNGYELFEKARKAVADDPKSAKHVEYTRMALQNAMLEWLPGTDSRLKDEIGVLISLAKELKIGYLGYGSRTLEDYREAVRKKIELGATLYPVKSGKGSTFGVTPSATAGYVDGVDYRDLIPKLDSIANLPDEGWLFKDDPQGIGTAQGYFRPNHVTGDFSKIRIGVDWDSQGYPGLGQGWYRLRYKSPSLLEGRRVFLHFGGVDESAWLYIDGKLAAWYDTSDPETTWDKPFLLEVTGSFKSQSEHVLVIRVGNTIGAGGIWKPVSLMIEK